VANNAVAAVTVDGSCYLLSALGIGGGLTFADITTDANLWVEGDAGWSSVDSVPGGVPRVAASAVGLRGKFYVLGGYSVDENGLEVSSLRVDVFDPVARTWSTAPSLLIAIDDAIAVAWRDRFIVVVSGWSGDENVDAVQIYDADSDQWGQATAFPGIPVFGGSGAIVGDELVVIDGVEAGRFGFTLVNQAWKATLDEASPNTIVWEDLGGHPGPARYRAAAGATAGGSLWFHGGTEIPYNFDGLAYEGGAPAPPLATTLTYQGGFAIHGEDKPEATMDHRALARCGSAVYVVGGMTSGPLVSSKVWRFQE
jgi:N-acetylneuraminic acid mutarotase